VTARPVIGRIRDAHWSMGDGPGFAPHLNIKATCRRRLGLVVLAEMISDPPPLTDEDFKRIDEEGRKARLAYLESTKDMEVKS
jgi:hypothetical protein